MDKNCWSLQKRLVHHQIKFTETVCLLQKMSSELKMKNLIQKFRSLELHCEKLSSFHRVPHSLKGQLSVQKLQTNRDHEMEGDIRY